jgi:ABC-type glycerol-3-phosphate transport system substrate-binding protein
LRGLAAGAAGVAGPAALAACGATGAGQGNGGTAASAPATVAGKITMAYRLRSPHTEVYGAIADEFKQQNPGVQLETEPVPGDFKLKVLELFASGTEPDTFWAEVGLFPGYVAKKMVLNLDQYAKRDAKAARLDDVFTGVMDQARSKNVLYGVPGDGGGPLVYWNAGMLERIGLPSPGQLNESSQWTVDRFLDIAKRSVRKGTAQGDVFGTEGHFAAYPIWLAWVYGWGGDILNKDGTGIVIDQPAGVEALQWLQDLSLRQGVAPNAAESATLRDAKLGDRRDLFAAERVALISDYTTAQGAGGILEAEKRGLRWDATVLPAGKSGQFSVAQFHPFVAASSSKAPEAAWKLLVYQSGPEATLRKALSGSSQPYRKSTSSAQEYLKTRPPYFGRSLEKLGTVTRPLPQTIEQEQFNGVLNEEITALRDGVKSALEAARAIKQRGEPLLRAGA